MKNKLINKTILFAISLVVSFSFIACDTDIESLDFEPTKVEDVNPELYKEYLESLRIYKNSDHNIVYTWFDNSVKSGGNRAAHITSVPDSVDYIVLMFPDNLADWEIEEMDKVREKGTKVLASIDFDKIKVEYDQRIEDLINEGADVSEEPTFVEELAGKAESILKVINKYNYDGLLIGYKGKSILHMTEKEKTEFLSYQKAFIGITSSWKENNPNKLLVFAGKPQNVIYKTSFDLYKHIIIPTEAATNGSFISYEVSIAMVEGIPTDRIIVTSQTTSMDETDLKTGYWADGSLSIPSTAQWVLSSNSSYDVVGIGVYNVNNDYYNSTFTYSALRNAIKTLNPTL